MNSMENGGGPKVEFEAMRKRWTELNETYDAKIASLFEDPAAPVNQEDVITLRHMQKELFELESTLLKRFES
jgi:hypothetical protein